MDYTTPDIIACVICAETVTLHDVTAGSLYANGQQAFACITHLQERKRWLMAWMAFELDQWQAGQRAAVTRDVL